MKSIVVSLFFLGFSGGSVTYSQEDFAGVAKEHKFYLDYVMGPYLFIDHIPYDAVFMNGCRLGFNIKRHFGFSIEYVVGQQQDDQNTLGMTHNVNGQFAYHPIPQSELFNPYLFVPSEILNTDIAKTAGLTQELYNGLNSLEYYTYYC